jgi:hypothetical protein
MINNYQSSSSIWNISTPSGINRPDFVMASMSLTCHCDRKDSDSESSSQRLSPAGLKWAKDAVLFAVFVLIKYNRDKIGEFIPIIFDGCFEWD